MTGLRIVSLLPSATEIVAALGLGDRLVGRSHECDFPPSLGRVPVCTAANLDVGATSGEIDREVRELLGNALSIYRIDGDLLRALRPDVILTQDRCEVCAVGLEQVEAATREALGPALRIVALHPASLEDVFADAMRIAAAVDALPAGERLVSNIRERLADVAAATSALGRPRTLCLEWIDPPMASVNWMPELVAHAGGESLLSEAGRPSPRISFDAIAEADPDAIMILPCGFDVARTRRDLAPLIGVPGWNDLAAVAGGRVYLADGNRYFNRPGPHLADSAEMLAEMLHPGAVDYGFGGTAWEPLGAGGR